jgi:hypothetical protein
MNLRTITLDELIAELTPDARAGLEAFFTDLKDQQVELRRNSTLVSELVPAQRITYTLRRVEKTGEPLDYLSSLKWNRSIQSLPTTASGTVEDKVVWELEILRKSVPIKDSETKVV